MAPGLYACIFTVFRCHFLAPWNAADWLSQSDLCGLEPAVEELLGHLLEGSTTGQFNQLLQLIRDGLDSSKLCAGNHKVRPDSCVKLALGDSCSIILFLSSIVVTKWVKANNTSGKFRNDHITVMQPFNTMS